MDKGISCILTCYKRPQNLRAQINALNTQTVKPAQLVIYQNEATAVDVRQYVPANAIHVKVAPNMGVWPRFMFGLELKTDYVCVFDDDTIPGARWLENCLNTMKTHRGLLGAVGVLFNGVVRTMGWTRVGWPSPSNDIRRADIVGHSWFFERDWLRYYALEPRHGCDTCGEDYHFSVAIQKHLKLNTYVPAHPAQDKTLWGSIQGKELGTDAVALYRGKAEPDNKARAHAGYIAAGWKLVSMTANKV